MNVNYKWIAIGVVFVLLMVFVFGRNPVEEARQQADQQRAARGGDAVLQEIEDRAGSAPVGAGYGRPLGNPVPPPSTLSPYGNAPSLNPPASVGAPPPVNPADGYYPPPAADPGKRSSTDFQLTNGMQVAFSGTRVFTYDEEGHRKLMPDGEYQTTGGLQIVVRSGQRILASNN